MASAEGKKAKSSQSGGLRRRSGSQQTLRTPTIQRQPGAAVTLRGWLYKQGSDGLMLWKKRWFVLSQYCLFYYQGPEEEKVLGSILLPSYRIIPCGSEDKVYRKYGFKAEHHNTRTYYFAAENKESMIQWMNALSLAAILLEDNGDPSARHSSTFSSVFTNGGDRTLSKANSASAAAIQFADIQPLNCSFDSTASSDRPQRQPVYANAPPKPKRLNNSLEYSSSPDTTQLIAQPAVTMPSSNGKEKYARNGTGSAVTPVTHHQVMYSSERRTPDAYGRFKADYEDVYNNGSCSSGSSRTPSSGPTNFAHMPIVNSNATLGRAPRPQSADFLSGSRSRDARKSLQQPKQLLSPRPDPVGVVAEPKKTPSFWSEENYAHQLRQASILHNYPRSRDSSHSSGGAAVPQQLQQHQQQQQSAASIPRVARQEEISRDVKESALWSYVQQHGKSSSRKLASSTSYGISNSQENLADEPAPSAPYFARSASARIPRGRRPDVLNVSLPASEHQQQQQQQHFAVSEMRTTEQREESMKRLLEWKQRMLQSPLTRKSGQRSGSERNTPTPQSLIDSPRLQQRREPLRSPKLPESYQTLTIPPRKEQLPGPGETRRPSQSPASSPLYSNVQVPSETGSLRRPVVAPSVESCETPKSTKPKLNEADVRKEFTYEYVSDSASANGNVSDPKPELWPMKKSTLMREKSSAMQDLRARSESPSANKVLGRDGKLPVTHKEPEAVTPPKVKPKPPPKPTIPVAVVHEVENQPQDRSSLAESLPESLAGFAATIISEETGSLQEVTVSPIPSENSWPSFPADTIPTSKGKEENLYMNTTAGSQLAAVEDHYLPMTSARTSVLAQPSPVSFTSKPEFEENTYVEMNDGESSRRGTQSKSVFAGIMDPSYCPPESPRYSEISDTNFEEQPHYEFIYKTSSHHYEPVYMEVPQNDGNSTIVSENMTEIMDLSGSVASLKISADQNGTGRVPSASELENKGDPPQDLDLLIPPRHPRFSLSDTFRPASYFLNTGKKTVKRMETIPAKEEGETAEEVSLSPVPVPPTNPHVDSFLLRNHSRSQSLDETRPGSSSSRRISLPGSPSIHSGSAEASKRRPLTEVRSLEDLLNESVANSTFQEESSSSLAQPLYENVASGGGNGAGSCTLDAEIVGAKLTNNASTVHQRVNSTLSSLSLASSASTSSVTRSEHSGAPYYYSDLIAGNKVPSQVNLPNSGRDSSLRGRLYNKHGERLRPNFSRDLERQSYGSSRQVNSSLSSPMPSTLTRSQTPDLLNNCSTTSSTMPSRTPGVGGEVMRRVRSLEGLLDEDNNVVSNVRTSLVSPTAMSPRPPSALTETPRYARDPTFRKPRENRSAAEASDMSPWDEDRLWREKLRNASLRHSRSLDMLDETQESRPRREAIAGEESERYERLLQYSATLERSKRGQTYLDGYVWDEVEQRFRKSGRDSGPPGGNSSNPGKRFLEERLPPAFEIDREKLRQWDLMSSAPISNARGKGGRQTSTPNVIIGKAQASQGETVYRRQPLSPTHGRQIQLSPPGHSIKSGGGSSNAETLGKPAGMNGTLHKDVTYERAPVAAGSPERVPQYEETEHSDSDVPLRKGKLPAMVGHNRDGSEDSERLPLSAGDLLGRTHEELVLLLIQLRRQSSALIKARDACILEMESQVKVASLDLAHRQECLAKVGDLKRHVKELEKQMEKLKPLVNLVDNMVKLGSLYPNEKRLMNSKAPKTPLKVNPSPIYSNIGHYATLPHAHQQPRAPQYAQYSPRRRQEPQESQYTYMERQRDQLELKRQQLSRLERFVQEEGAAIQKLTQNENVLKLALRGVRDQNNAALRSGNYAELDHCRAQQDYLERELSGVHSLLAQSSKRLEDKAVEISRIEQEISVLHQQLHRVSRNSTLRSPHSQTASQSGRELSWLEAELSRVQQHVSQLQTRRQELTSQITRLTDHQLQNRSAVPAPSWCETDLDTMHTYDQSASLPVWDINEADERMKRYYGIIPKEKPAEIRTVRLVKREAGKRKTRKPDDLNFESQDEMLDDSVASTVTEEEGYHTSSQDPDDPILTDPVLSQFSHVLTLPRKRDNKRLSNPELNNSPIRISRRPASSLSLVEPACAPAAANEEETSLESGSQPSPILTPVYTSDAAREIIEEMRRQDMAANRRSVPRHKRRHLTVSCSQPLALEAKATPTPLMGGSKVRARDDLDMERALRFQHPFAPDVVRSTIGRPLRITDKTIDKILVAPDKILIPERYVPEQEVEEPDEEEKRKRLQKTESIRRMLAGSTPVELPRPPTEGGAASETLRPSEARQLLAKERRQRDHFISLNRVLAQEMKEKSKMVAARSVSMERLTVAP